MALKKKPSRKQSARKKSATQPARAHLPVRSRAAEPAALPEPLPKDLLGLRAIEHLARLMETAGLQEVEIQDGPDRRLRLSRRAGHDGPVVYRHEAAPAPAPAAPAAPPLEAEARPGAKPANVIDFVSPMVGTFYRGASPESPPYVTPGDRVSADTVLCIIEAMKVMNEIRAEMNGEVVDILVENGEAVEFGQPLFHIRLAS